MKRGWCARESARRHKAVAVAHTGVAGCAENVITLAAAVENLPGYRKGQIVARTVANFSGIEISVFVQLSTRHSAFDGRASRTLVGKEFALRQGIHAWLHLHVEAAGREQHSARKRDNNY